ncbi:MAG: flotillin family protein, partial [Bacteroidota bacterium]
DQLTVVDSGQPGSGVPAVFNSIAGATPALLESLKASTGIDVAGLLRVEENSLRSGGEDEKGNG